MNLINIQSLKLPENTMQYLIVAAILALCGWVAWVFMGPKPPEVGTIEPATPAPVVKNISKETIRAPIITVYAPKAKAKLQLPKAQQADRAVHVIEASRVEPDDHPTTVITTINTDTGITETVVRREPLPWLALKKSGELRLDYGLKGTVKIARLSLRQDIVQVKSMYVGARASLDSDGTIFAGIGVGYRW